MPDAAVGGSLAFPGHQSWQLRGCTAMGPLGSCNWELKNPPYLQMAGPFLPPPTFVHLSRQPANRLTAVLPARGRSRGRYGGSSAGLVGKGPRWLGQRGAGESLEGVGPRGRAEHGLSGGEPAEWRVYHERGLAGPWKPWRDGNWWGGMGSSWQETSECRDDLPIWLSFVGVSNRAVMMVLEFQFSAHSDWTPLDPIPRKDHRPAGMWNVWPDLWHWNHWRHAGDWWVDEDWKLGLMAIFLYKLCWNDWLI